MELNFNLAFSDWHSIAAGTELDMNGKLAAQIVIGFKLSLIQ